MGDSFTFGDEVSDNETYPHYLQQMLPHIEVINTGVHGYGHDQMLILYKEEGIKYEPDIVILGFVYRDMSRNLLLFRDYANPEFVVANKELKLTGSPVPSPEDVIKWDWARLRIFDITSMLVHRFKVKSGRTQKDMKGITAHILNEIIDVTDKIQAIPIFVYLPTGREISQNSRLTPGEEFLFTFCKTNGAARCFSARPGFSGKMVKGMKFRLRGHWGPLGHQTVAESIRRYLYDHGYIVRTEPLGKTDIWGLT